MKHHSNTKQKWCLICLYLSIYLTHCLSLYPALYLSIYPSIYPLSLITSFVPKFRCFMIILTKSSTVTLLLLSFVKLFFTYVYQFIVVPWHEVASLLRKPAGCNCI